ncbi:hypothetical protein ACOMHN_010334 [Nucella lapillus]
MTWSSSMKATPPLCRCGRRAKRRLVQSPGPNQGRWFFSCLKGTASTATAKSIGCGFFQWEHSFSMPSARPVTTPASRQTYFPGRTTAGGGGDARAFHAVLQAPRISQGPKRVGLSPLRACVLR